MPLNLLKKYPELLDFLSLTTQNRTISLRNIFNRDIVQNATFSFKGKQIYPIKTDGELDLGREFMHLTTHVEIDEEGIEHRAFDKFRSERLHWIRSHVEEKITDKTKAIVPVHYAGVSCEMDKILEIAEKYNISPRLACLIRNRDVIGDDAIEKYLHGTIADLHDGMLLKDMGKATAVGDEGGFAPDLESDEQAIEVIIKSIEKAGYTTAQIKIALDVASSEWYKDGEYLLPKRNLKMSGDELIAYIKQLILYIYYSSYKNDNIILKI